MGVERRRRSSAACVLTSLPSRVISAAARGSLACVLVSQADSTGPCLHCGRLSWVPACKAGFYRPLIVLVFLSSFCIFPFFSVLKEGLVGSQFEPGGQRINCRKSTSFTQSAKQYFSSANSQESQDLRPSCDIAPPGSTGGVRLPLSYTNVGSCQRYRRTRSLAVYSTTTSEQPGVRTAGCSALRPTGLGCTSWPSQVSACGSKAHRTLATHAGPHRGCEAQAATAAMASHSRARCSSACCPAASRRS